MEKIMLFQNENKTMTEILELINDIIKDSDAVEEKEAVRAMLKRFSDNFKFILVGDEATGKTTFINTFLQTPIVSEKNMIHTVGIAEYRWGSEKTDIELEKGYIRHFLPEECLKGVTIIDSEGIGSLNPLNKETLENKINDSDVLFVFFAADSVKSVAVWDFLERVKPKRVIFLLSKTDKLSSKQLEQNKEKLKGYMKDADIVAPIFDITVTYESEQQKEDGCEALRKYVQDRIGNNPILVKEYENIKEVKHLLESFKKSFYIRKRQYELDADVLKKVNQSLDTFCENNNMVVDGLKEELRNEIIAQIDAYKKEVIERLNPEKIKQNFPNGGSDFRNYLNFLNETYQKRMKEKIDRRTKEVIRKYLGDLEVVFETSTGFFRERESMIALEDGFYGSLGKDKQQMISEVEHSLIATGRYYKTITDVSDELFMQVWEARMNYEFKQRVAGDIGATMGGMLGFFGVQVVAPPVWPIVGAVLGAIVINKIVKEFAHLKNGPELERKVKGYIEEFDMEMEKSKAALTEKTLETIEEIFNQELRAVDQVFKGFRMAVNIEGKNIPLLEERIEKADELLVHINKMGGELLE